MTWEPVDVVLLVVMSGFAVMMACFGIAFVIDIYRSGKP